MLLHNAFGIDRAHSRSTDGTVELTTAVSQIPSADDQCSVSCTSVEGITEKVDTLIICIVQCRCVGLCLHKSEQDSSSTPMTYHAFLQDSRCETVSIHTASLMAKCCRSVLALVRRNGQITVIRQLQLIDLCNPIHFNFSPISPSRCALCRHSVWPDPLP